MSEQLEKIVIPFKYFGLIQLKWVLACWNFKKGNMMWSAKNYCFPKDRNYVDPEKLPVLTASSIDQVGKNCARLANQALVSSFGTVEVPKKIPEVRPNGILQYSSFHSMGLKSEILQKLTALDMKFPNGIQQYAIVPCLREQNAVIEAPSNSERTVVYIIGILSNIDLTKQHCQALIIVPIGGVQNVFQEFAKFPELTVVDAEDVSKKTREKKIQAGFHVLIGTFASITTWINCNFVDPDKIKIMVLDGAEFLSLGKQRRCRTIQHIFDKLNNGAPQTILVAEKSFSELTSLSQWLGINVVQISPKNFLKLSHFYEICANNSSAADSKMNNLRTILKQIPTRCSKIIIFCNSNQSEDALRLGRRFNTRTVFFISKTSHRVHYQQVFQEFEVKGGILIIRDRRLEILPPKCSLVIHFDLPIKYDNYVQKLNLLHPADGSKAVICLVTVTELFSLCEFLKKRSEFGNAWDAEAFGDFGTMI